MIRFRAELCCRCSSCYCNVDCLLELHGKRTLLHDDNIIVVRRVGNDEEESQSVVTD